MGLISCSVFKDKVLDGSKPHTIRFRKTAPVVGEILYLWWKSRTKEGELLGQSFCTGVDRIAIDPRIQQVTINGKKLSKPKIVALSKADGFDSFSAFWKYFCVPDVGYLIHWEPSYINQKRIMPHIVEYAGLETDKVGNLESWKPSNGSDIDITDSWCRGCDRDRAANDRKGCPILLDLILHQGSRHWIKIGDRPICTAFRPRVTKQTTIANRYARLEKAWGQLNLFQEAG